MFYDSILLLSPTEVIQPIISARQKGNTGLDLTLLPGPDFSLPSLKHLKIYDCCVIITGCGNIIALDSKNTLNFEIQDNLDLT